MTIRKVDGMMVMDGNMISEVPTMYAQGELKWYSPQLGYGFIVDRNTGTDILLGSGAIRRFGWRTIAKGSLVDACTERTESGHQVSKILNIVPPSEIDESRHFDFDALDYLSKDFVQARVTWYNKKKGYGFADTYGDGESCFIHWIALEEAGMLYALPGDIIAIKIGRGVNGRVAASIRSGMDQSKPANLGCPLSRSWPLSELQAG